jgi:hypothetical protein
MDILGALRNRIGGAIAAVFGAIMIFICGAAMAFWLSPQQALEWRRIQDLPVLDASGYYALEPGTQVAMTGVLEDNETLTSDGLVAFERAEWDVKESTDSDGDKSYSGTWNTVETNFPALTFSSGGGIIKTLPATPTTGGNLNETIVDGKGSLKASYNNRTLADGAVRTQGFKNGELVTFVGVKQADGSMTAERAFGGSKEDLVANIRAGAQVLFAAGIGMMICSPVVLIGGVLAALFGRGRRGINVGNLNVG